MNDDEINAKFRSLARRALSQQRVNWVLAALWRLDTAPGPGEIFEAVQTGGWPRRECGQSAVI